MIKCDFCGKSSELITVRSGGDFICEQCVVSKDAPERNAQEILEGIKAWKGSRGDRAWFQTAPIGETRKEELFIGRVTRKGENATESSWYLFRRELGAEVLSGDPAAVAFEEAVETLMGGGDPLAKSFPEEAAIQAIGGPFASEDMVKVFASKARQLIENRVERQKEEFEQDQGDGTVDHQWEESFGGA